MTSPATPADPPSGQSTLVGSLVRGTRLHEYVIERVLGHGGFGITYLAHDSHLDKKVAIKEYLPTDLAARAPNSTVTVRSPETREAFQWGLESFIKEARVLAKFSHASLIQVHRYFEANDTAYFVMDYAEGVTLSAVLRHEGALSEDRLRRILFPILNGLEEVHRLGVLHRDIKPDNIILREGSLPVLIDFGAARQTLSSMTRSVMSVLTAGYAPIEQYATSGNQGPWTDLYAIGAVAYRALSGQKPTDAVNRIRDDPMVPAATVGRGRYSEHFLAAIDWALALNPEDRPANVAEFKQALDGQLAPRPPAPAGQRSAAAVATWPVFAGPPGGEVTAITRPGTRKDAPVSRGLIAAGVGAGAVLLAVIAGIGLLRERQAVPPPVAATAPDERAAATTQPSAPPAAKPEPAPATAPQQQAQEPATAPPSRAAEPEPTAPRQAAPPPATAPAQQPPAQQAPAQTAPVEPAAPPAQAETQPQARPRPAAVAGMPPLTEFRDCPQCPRMVALAGGTFVMGAAPGDNGNKWEGPAHDVKLAQRFAIGRHEVTAAEWQACVSAGACAAAAGPAAGDPARLPVVNISWPEAQAYAAWLSERTGRRYRLPTEAEWEYAIRAGTTSGRYWGGDRTQQCRYGNGADQSALKQDPQLSAAECDDGFAALAPIGSFEPNAFGLFDMAGNAWEWTQDCWRDSYQGAPADGSAVDAAGCTRRVIRGGSWRARANSLRSFGRGHSPADTRSEDLGLRLVAE